MYASKNSPVVGETDPGKVIRVGEDLFTLTQEEWKSVKKLIEDKRQACAVSWWAEAFEIPRAHATLVINKLQCALMAELIC